MIHSSAGEQISTEDVTYPELTLGLGIAFQRAGRLDEASASYALLVSLESQVGQYHSAQLAAGAL
jgi:hypothetical protein